MVFEKFKSFLESRRQGRIEKAAKLVKNAKAMKDDRKAALEFLAELEDPEVAVTKLLPRFEYSLEHGINDTREKELAMEGIVAHGKSVLPAVKEWIVASHRIAWPIKILKKVGSDQEVVDVLKAALKYDDIAFDQAAIDKNYDILCYLRDYQLGEAGAQLVKFLHDSDERVRFACAEVLIEQEADFSKTLEPFLADESSENTRVRQSIIEAFINKSWTVNQPNVFPSGIVVSGVKISKDGLLTRMSSS